MRGLLVLMLSLVACGGRPSRPVAAEPSEPTAGYATAMEATPSPSSTPAEDYVSEQMALRAQAHAFDLVPSSYLETGTLTEGQEESFNTILEAGRCYRVLGVSTPSLSDLDLFIRDEHGNLLEQDTATDNFPMLGADGTLCPRWTGPFDVTVRAFRGAGDYGIQIFRTPS